MGVVAPGKRVFLGFARGEMGATTPGKRAIFGFARVEMGATTPGKRTFSHSARGDCGLHNPGKRTFFHFARVKMGWSPLANSIFSFLPGAHGENQRTNDIHLLMQDRPYLTNQNRTATAFLAAHHFFLSATLTRSDSFPHLAYPTALRIPHGTLLSLLHLAYPTPRLAFPIALLLAAPPPTEIDYSTAIFRKGQRHRHPQ